MNEVYLNEDGELFVNGHLIKDVISVVAKSEFAESHITIQFSGSYKSDFTTKLKKHSIEECSKE